MPECIWSANSGEFTTSDFKNWLKGLNMKTSDIESAPLGKRVSKGNLRNECLDLQDFHTLKEARVIIGEWVQEYNHIGNLEERNVKILFLVIRTWVRCPEATGLITFSQKSRPFSPDPLCLMACFLNNLFVKRRMLHR
jgi:hypothetical protein